jgi:N-acetylneuraminic acid mutarotase
MRKYPLGTPPTPRRDASGFYYNGELIIFGGFDEYQYANDIYAFNIQNNQWYLLYTTSMVTPSPRRLTQLAFITPSTFALFGGQDAQNENNDVWIFERGSISWTLVKPANFFATKPAPRYDHCNVVYNGTIYVFGGIDTQGTRLNDMWMLSLDGSSNWVSINSSISARSGQACIHYGQYMWIVGGSNANGPIHDHYKFDFISQTFTKLNIPDSHADRYQTEITNYGDYLVWYGGAGANSRFNDLWRYIPISDTAEKIHDNMYSPIGLTQHTVCTLANSMFFFGGITFSGAIINTLQQLVLTDTTATWVVPTVIGNAPTRRFGHSAVSLADVMFIFGGQTDNSIYLNDMYLLSMYVTQLAWISVSYNNNGPEARSGHCSVTNTTHMFIFGGQSQSGQVLQDLWVFDMYTYYWTQLSVANAPAQTIGCNALISNNRIIISGCYDAASTPLASIYYLNVSAPVLQWAVYASYGSVPVTSNHRMINVASDTFYMFGGEKLGSVNNNLYQLVKTASKTTWTKMATTSPLLPQERSQHVAAYVGDRLFAFGGTGSQLGSQFKFNSIIYSDTWAYNVGPVCLNSNTSVITTSSCYLCSAGSYHNNGLCTLCPMGNYSETVGSLSCKACAAGYFGPYLGAQSYMLCYPCPMGQYNPT